MTPRDGNGEGNSSARPRRRWVAILGLLLGLALVGGIVSVTRLRAPPAAGLGPAPTPKSQDDDTLDRCDTSGWMPCPRQVLFQAIPIAGTSVMLTYSSDRVPGRRVDGAPEVAGVGLGGWTLSVLNSLDPRTNTLITGLGELRHVAPKAVSIGAGVFAVADSNGRRVDVFDAAGRDVAVYDAFIGSRLLRFQWDKNGLRQVLDGANVELTVQRDPMGKPIQLLTARGHPTELTLQSGWLAATRDPLGHLVSLEMDTLGLLRSVTDAKGATREFEFDPQGRLVSMREPTGARTTLSRAVGNHAVAVTSTGPTGARTVDTLELRANGQRHYIHSAPEGLVTTMDVLADHRDIVLPDGRHIGLDLKGDPDWGLDAPWTARMSVKDPGTGQPPVIISETRTSDGTFNTAHNAHNTVTVDGKVWQYDFEAKTRRFSLQDPLGRRRGVTYDPSGHIGNRFIGTAVVATYRYDTNGRRVSRVEGTGSDARTWTYRYSDNGELTLEDPLGRRSVQKFDPSGALFEIEGPGALGLQLSTDSTGLLDRFGGPGQGRYRIARRTDGRVAAVTAPPGDGPAQYTLYDYDARGLETSRSWPDAVETWQRDASGRVTAVDRGAGTWSFRYDGAGHLIASDGPGATVTQRYTGAQRTAERVKGPFDVEVSRTSDGFGRTVTQTLGALPPIVYSYDASGLLTRAGDLTLTRDPATGLITQETLGVLTRHWLYNRFGEPTRQSVVKTDGTQIAAMSWRRDSLGRIIETSQQFGTAAARVEQFTYDPAGRLATWKVGTLQTRYDYDAAGNLITVTPPSGTATHSSYDARNALIERAGERYGYNGAGQRVSRTDTAGVTQYNYDLQGALLKVTRPGAPLLQYTVDAAGRRVAKSLAGQPVSGMVYDDRNQPLAELDANGAVVLRYIHTDADLSMYANKQGKDYLEIMDGVGSPVGVIDASNGASVATISRDPLGRVTADSAPGFQLLGFAGGLEDADTGLVRFGARDYDPQTGRWTAPDPLSLGGGSPNLYAYVGSDPVNRTDRTGLCDVEAIGVGINMQLGPLGFSIYDGVVFTPTSFGVYDTLGAGTGLGFSTGGVINCYNTDDPNDHPGVDAFSGPGSSLSGALGPLGVGDDQSKSSAAGGGHVDVGAGLGVTYQRTATDVVCLVHCAHTGGDPHLRTVNGTTYDFQAVGEFIALTSDTGDLVVQVRTQPMGQSTHISLNQVAAVNVLGDRVLVSHSADGDVEVVANGSPLSAFAALVLPHGARIARTPSKATVTLPDGSAVMISANAFGLDLSASLAQSRRTHVQGLLGPFDPDSVASALRSREGASFTPAQFADYDTLYRKFGDSWRISPHESLFSYPPGQSTDTYTNRKFPERTAPVLPEDRRAAAERLCAAMSLPASAVAGCIMDVALTGEAGFAVSTADSLGAVPGQAPRLASTPSPTASNSIAPGETVRGHLDANGSIRYDFDVSAGAVGYFARAPGCDPTGALRWKLESADGTRALADSPICSDIGRIAFPQTGRYRLSVYSYNGGSGPYQATWRVSRPDQPLTLAAGETASGKIELPGAANVYALEVKPGAVAYFKAAAACDATHTLRWSLESADSAQVMGNGGTCADLGRKVFPQGGHYRLRVYSYNGDTGAYQVSWLISRPDQQLTLQAGETASGHIEAPGAEDLYAMTVTPGAVGYFKAAPDCDGSQGLRWSVESADGGTLASGTLCSDIGRVDFPRAGRYRLHVYSYNGGTGSYRASWVVSRPDKTFALKAGDATAGEIDLPGAADRYALEVAAGEVGYFKSTAECPAASGLRWRMESVDDGTISSDGPVCSDGRKITFAKTGHYALRVYSYNGGTGRYRMSWTRP